MDFGKRLLYLAVVLILLKLSYSYHRLHEYNLCPYLLYTVFLTQTLSRLIFDKIIFYLPIKLCKILLLISYYIIILVSHKIFKITKKKKIKFINFQILLLYCLTYNIEVKTIIYNCSQ